MGEGTGTGGGGIGSSGGSSEVAGACAKSREREDGPATGVVEVDPERAAEKCREVGARVGWKDSSSTPSSGGADKGTGGSSLGSITNESFLEVCRRFDEPG